jgi:hypothetical protein
VRPVQVSHTFVVCSGGREQLRIGQTPSRVGHTSRRKGSFVQGNGQSRRADAVRLCGLAVVLSPSTAARSGRRRGREP